VFVDNHAPCDDGLFCTVADVCSEGQCQGGASRGCPSDGNECTIEVCNEDDDMCESLCDSSGVGGACCDDPLCGDDPRCRFEGGDYLVTVTHLEEQPATCLFGPLSGVLPALVEQLQDMLIPVTLPPGREYPTPVTLSIPALGEMEIVADYVDGEIVFDPLALPTVDLLEALEPILPTLPPELVNLIQAFMSCTIDATIDGWTSGVTSPVVDVLLRTYGFDIQRGSGTGLCFMPKPPAGSPCSIVSSMAGSLAEERKEKAAE